MIESLTVVVPLPPKRLNPNLHLHPNELARVRAEYLEECIADIGMMLVVETGRLVRDAAPWDYALVETRGLYLMASRGPAKGGIVRDGVDRYRPADATNLVAALKPAYDALTQTRYIVDDGFRNMVLGRTEIVPLADSSSPERIEFVISPA